MKVVLSEAKPLPREFERCFALSLFFFALTSPGLAYCCTCCEKENQDLLTVFAMVGGGGGGTYVIYLITLTP